jgi:hypothetical protein
MAKSFKKFRDEWDNEWEGDDEIVRNKEQRMQNRRNQRKTKAQEKYAAFDESDEE